MDWWCNSKTSQVGWASFFAHAYTSKLINNHVATNRFGFSLAAIWLPDNVDPEPATELLDRYLEQRYQQARKIYEQQ